MKGHELGIIAVLAIGSVVAIKYYKDHHKKLPAPIHPIPYRPPPRMIPRQKDVHQPHYLANQRFPYDNDPWNIGIPTPLKGLPMNVDTWRGTGGTNRIAKEVRNTQMLYGGRGAT